MESEAALCYLPLLLLKRHASVTIQNCKIEYDKCISAGTHKDKCLIRYESTMENPVKTRIAKLYEGYLKNFDSETGKIKNRKIE